MNSNATSIIYLAFIPEVGLTYMEWTKKIYRDRTVDIKKCTDYKNNTKY